MGSKHFSDKEIENWIKEHGMRTMEGIDRWASKIRRYNKKVHELWEEAKQLNKPERVVKQLDIIALFRDRLKEEAESLISHCSDLINSWSDLLIEDYYRDIDGCLKKIEAGEGEWTSWLLCGEMFLFHKEEVLNYEMAERFGAKYELEDYDLIHYEGGVDDNHESYSIDNRLGNHWVLASYCRYRGTFPYKLCRSLIDFYVERSVGTDAWERFVALIRTVCLYTALINQEDDLKDNKIIFVDHSAHAPASAPQANEVELPAELDTERARKSFRNAVKAGFMERTEDGYHWTFGGNRGKVRLGYFLVKVYCPTNTEQLPLKAVENLFNVERLDSAINRFNDSNKNQKWIPQIDELIED